MCSLSSLTISHRGISERGPIANFVEEEETEAIEIMYSGPTNTILLTLSDNSKKHYLVISGK